MLRVSTQSCWRAKKVHGATRNADWGILKKTRVHVQNLLCYERIETGKGNAKRVMGYTDSLFNICNKGPASLSDLQQNSRQTITNYLSIVTVMHQNRVSIKLAQSIGLMTMFGIRIGVSQKQQRIDLNQNYNIPEIC